MHIQTASSSHEPTVEVRRNGYGITKFAPTMTATLQLDKRTGSNEFIIARNPKGEKSTSNEVLIPRSLQTKVGLTLVVDWPAHCALFSTKAVALG